MQAEATPSTTAAPEIIGRQSSHYTRMVRMLAEELALAHTFTPIFDLLSRDAATFAGNPALKLPIMRHAGAAIYGSGNICRVLARSAPQRRVCLPEDAATPLLMNAHEVLAHAMAAQVEVVLHEFVAKRPPDEVSRKRRDSLLGCLHWLEQRLPEIDAALPADAVRAFDIALFCLLEHLRFRGSADVSALPGLSAFAQAYAERDSARATPYRYDAPP